MLLHLINEHETGQQTKLLIKSTVARSYDFTAREFESNHLALTAWPMKNLDLQGDFFWGQKNSN